MLKDINLIMIVMSWIKIYKKCVNEFMYFNQYMNE